MTERADGVIELRAALPVPADQRWFWAERWQEREREVDEHVAAGPWQFTSRPRTSLATSTRSSTLSRFTTIVREKFAPACDAHAKDPITPWPASSRVTPMRSAPGILEMTWSFAGPDRRTTFELVTVEGELRCRWRRVGDHEVFRKP